MQKKQVKSTSKEPIKQKVKLPPIKETLAKNIVQDIEQPEMTTKSKLKQNITKESQNQNISKSTNKNQIPKSNYSPKKEPILTNNKQNNLEETQRSSEENTNKISQNRSIKNNYKFRPHIKIADNTSNSPDNVKTNLNLPELPRISKEKLTELQEKRKKRLKAEKKQEMKEKKLYNELVNEYKTNRNKSLENISLDETPTIKISEKRAQKILEEGGMLDAYKYLITQLCKCGLPDGNLFEYASIVIKNYEKKWKEKKSQMIKEKIEQYFENKKKEINATGEINKTIENRDLNLFIKNLDKSRSNLRIMKREKFSSFSDNENNNNDESNDQEPDSPTSNNGQKKVLTKNNKSLREINKSPEDSRKNLYGYDNEKNRQTNKMKK